jgi:hypothetical protein
VYMIEGQISFHLLQLQPSVICMMILCCMAYCDLPKAIQPTHDTKRVFVFVHHKTLFLVFGYRNEKIQQDSCSTANVVVAVALQVIFFESRKKS